MRLAPLAAAGLVVACTPAASDASGGGAGQSAAPGQSAAAERNAVPAQTAIPGQGPRFGLPIACTPGRTCEVQHYVDRDPGPGVRDYRCGRRTYDGHKGVDFRIPDMAAQRRGVAVLAAAPGRVARLRDGVDDVSIRQDGAPPVEGRECGNGVVIDHGGGWETQYCHLARGSLRVKVGDTVAAGQPLGLVGLSGATEFPHLHFQVHHDGRVTDPWAPAGGDGCNAGTGTGAGPSGPLWSAEVVTQTPYVAGAVLNLGFAAGPVAMGNIEDGAIAAPTRSSPYIVAYGRGIGLRGGDEVEISLTGPGGAELAHGRQPPLDRDKAQYMAYAGKKRPVDGWPAGAYTARMRVYREGRVALERSVSMRL